MHTVPLVFKSWRGPPLLGLPMREAPLTHEIVLIAQQLPLPQRDPADRFLAATAQLAARSSGYTRAGQWALEELASKVVALSFTVAPFGRAVTEDCWQPRRVVLPFCQNGVTMIGNDEGDYDQASRYDAASLEARGPHDRAQRGRPDSREARGCAASRQSFRL